MESSYILLLLLLSSSPERCLGRVGIASDIQRVASCPAAEDIIPCACFQEDQEVLDMDCSEVADENELAAVFQANFPSTSFRRLTIKANQNLKTLRSGDLGDASFQEIWITQGGLEEIQEGALSSSASTVIHLVFNYNHISSFPFVELETFTEVLSLDLRHNNIRGFPMLFSATLETLYLSGNPLGELPPSAFSKTSALVDIHLSSANITQVTLGVFRDLQNLRNLGLGNNLLTSLAGGFFQCSPSTGLIDLGYNQLASVSPDSFTDCYDVWIYVHHNALTVLDEDPWKYLVLNGCYIDPYGNPLECGCDIAWAVRNSSLLQGFDIYSTCADGRLLVELDPADFEHC